MIKVGQRLYHQYAPYSKNRRCIGIYEVVGVRRFLLFYLTITARDIYSSGRTTQVVIKNHKYYIEGVEVFVTSDKAVEAYWNNSKEWIKKSISEARARLEKNNQKYKQCMEIFQDLQNKMESDRQLIENYKEVGCHLQSAYSLQTTQKG